MVHHTAHSRPKKLSMGPLQPTNVNSFYQFKDGQFQFSTFISLNYTTCTTLSALQIYQCI